MTGFEIAVVLGLTALEGQGQDLPEVRGVVETAPARLLRHPLAARPPVGGPLAPSGAEEAPELAAL